ncbi:MAG: hypothetical protein ACK5JT_08270 [Hyphomicrobiaceae bacterium]
MIILSLLLAVCAALWMGQGTLRSVQPASSPALALGVEGLETCTTSFDGDRHVTQPGVVEVARTNAAPARREGSGSDGEQPSAADVTVSQAAAPIAHRLAKPLQSRPELARRYFANSARAPPRDRQQS